MTHTIDTQTYTIDATNKSLGRVATEAAHVLMGKNSPSFARHIRPTHVSVAITNASKLALSEKKKDKKTYIRFSGHPGGQKKETLSERIVKKGYAYVVRNTIYGMLPNNRLRKDTMKRLEITE